MKTVHYGPGGGRSACPSTSSSTSGTVGLVTCRRCLAIVAQRDAARDAAAVVDRASPRPRLLTIEACRQCPHSRDADICAHPEVPGATDDLGFGDPPRRYRALPLAASRYGSCASNAPPPDWCPLPPALTETPK